MERLEHPPTVPPAADIPPESSSVAWSSTCGNRSAAELRASGETMASGGDGAEQLTVDYALNNGLIVTDGYINGPGQGAPVTLVVVGGTGAYAGASGYGRLQPTATGSNVTLHLAG
jgi:hypothetical protein